MPTHKGIVNMGIVELRKENLKLRRTLKDREILISVVSEVKDTLKEHGKKIDDLKEATIINRASLESVSGIVEDCDYCQGRASEASTIKELREEVRTGLSKISDSQSKMEKKLGLVLFISTYPIIGFILLYLIVKTINGISPLDLIKHFISSLL